MSVTRKPGVAGRRRPIAETGEGGSKEKEKEGSGREEKGKEMNG